MIVPLLKRLRGDSVLRSEVRRLESSIAKLQLAADELPTGRKFVNRALTPWLKTARWHDADHAYFTLRGHLENDSLWRFGRGRTHRLAEYYRVLTAHMTLPGARVVEVGCGVHHSLAMSTVFRLNGAAEVFAIDLREMRDKARDAVALYDLIADCVAMPEEWCWDNAQRNQFFERAWEFDRASLRRGRLDEGLRHVPCHRLVGDLSTLRHATGPVDAVVSYSVLEHVADPDETVAALAEIVRPGGVMVHHVDFQDHRRREMPDDPLARWRFLVTDDAHARTHCNRVRISELDATLRRNGFEIEALKRVETDLPEGLRAALLPDYQSLSDADLRTIVGRYVLRRR